MGRRIVVQELDVLSDMLTLNFTPTILPLTINHATAAPTTPSSCGFPSVRQHFSQQQRLIKRGSAAVELGR